MSNLLKNIYTREFYDNFTVMAGEVIPSFDPKQFKQLIFDPTWESKELKQRMRHTALVLHKFMPQNFEHASVIIKTIVGKLLENNINEVSLEYMFLPDYIELYGLDNIENAITLFEFITPFTSCEFAVRPFIIKYPEKMMKQMLIWSKHENHHVRRLSSEGSRPRLPWAIALPEFKTNPGYILPILENLKYDTSEYVRRSVANNLNDIAKDNPQIVIELAKKWKGTSKETDAVVKHGCRTLLKQGNPDILELFGFDCSDTFQLTYFKLLTPKVQIGNNLEFEFSLKNMANDTQTVRLEYAVYFLKLNGQFSKKVFKISESQIRQNDKRRILRKHSFKVITTKKYYRGTHKLSIIINGQELEIYKFELI